MKVRAIKKGYFDGRIKRDGVEFEVQEDKFSPRWMEKLDAQSVEPARKGKKPEERKPSSDVI